ncbi:energy-coupled thiamine transporter ThiT [Alkaliphilus transvaalensis]|uniref:energy-coupled thiamine transporter ThiT n=1 Tax=Alkaliphilus transvaalensis TaxID=114628 RepID=UPI0006861A60|nr:energy-coupled thiamine transporter ThiT [Alkaliphilus transvaalensis]
MLDALKNSEITRRLFAFNSTTLSILAVLIIIGLGGAIFLWNSRKTQFTTRVLVYGSLCIALSFVLSYIRLFRMPQGGSITPASMLPLILFAVMFGPIPGIVAGFAFGFLQYIQGGYVVHWVQVLLDYPIAFGMIGLAGLYRKNITISILLAALGRLVIHVISGVIFFASATPEGTPVLVYSLTYNGSFLLIEVLICSAIAIIPQVKNVTKHVQGYAKGI